jgi:hypothetical protein
MSRKDRLRADGGGVPLSEGSDPGTLFVTCERGNGSGVGRETAGYRPSVRGITGGFVSRG